MHGHFKVVGTLVLQVALDGFAQNPPKGFTFNDAQELQGSVVF